MQSASRSWLTLLACLAAVGAARGQVGMPPDAAAAPAEPAAPAAPADAAASGLGLNWRGAPISVSGLVSYDLRASSASGETNSLSQLITTSLSARSYIYQPWFATVSGTLAVTAGKSRGGGEDLTSQSPFATQDQLASKDRFITGNARLDLFPRSRFPFEVHVERTDSRVDSALASSLDFRTQTVGVSQRYQPVNGAYTVSGSFERRQQSGTGFRDVQDTLMADFTTQWKHNDLSLGLSQSQARRFTTEERTEFRSLVARHQYAPSNGASVNTTVNWTQTQENVVTAPSDLSVLQWSSIGLWHPDGSKLTLTGSVRGLTLRDAFADNGLDTLSLTLGANYELNRNARFTANATATTTDSNGTAARGFGGSVGASWQSDTVEFKGLRYDWFTSGTIGGSTTSGPSTSSSSASSAGAIDPSLGSETQTTLNAQLGHTLSRSWPITSQSVLVLNGGQTLAATQNHSSHPDPAVQDSVRTLLNTIGATWSANGDNRSAYARASYNDSIELGGGHARFQLFNFQLSGNFEFDRNRSLGGDLTLQRVTQRAGDLLQPAGLGLLVGERTTTTGASGEITYRQQRVFGVPRLRFTSRLKLAQDVLKQPGTFATIPDRETRLWENRLDWLIGRLETQLLFRLSEVDGKRRNFLMFRVQRTFGD